MVDADTQVILSEIKKSEGLWILKDEHGCVMLTTDDEDGVPIWSAQASAEAWANEEWSHCETLFIGLDTWKKRWTQGLSQDQLTIMINPSEQQEGGVVLTPDEFEQLL